MKMQAIQRATANTKITPLALKVFTRLVEHHNMKTGQCNPSNGTLARALGASERGVRGAIRQLEKHGLIETRPGGGRHRSNDYAIPALNTRQTRNAPTRNPERKVTNTRNVISAETIKETIKKRTDENAVNKPAKFGKLFSDRNAEKEEAQRLGRIQSQLAELIGDNGWEILVEQTEFCEKLCKQVANNDVSLKEAKHLLLKGSQRR